MKLLIALILVASSCFAAGGPWDSSSTSGIAITNETDPNYTAWYNSGKPDILETHYGASTIATSNGGVCLSGATNVLNSQITLARTIVATSVVVDTVDFNTNATPPTQAGRLKYNAADGTLDIGYPGGNVNNQIGQELNAKVVNKTGATITNGMVVSICGAQGQRLKVCPVDISSQTSADGAFAVATEDIADNAEGYVTTFGYVRDFNTSAWPVSSVVYAALSPKGSLTTNYPTAPNVVVRVGTVVQSHPTQGELYVTLRSIPRLQDLSDVNGTPLISNGQIMVWNNTSKYFDPTLNMNSYPSNSPVQNAVFSNITLYGNVLLTNTVWHELTAPASFGRTIPAGANVAFDPNEGGTWFNTSCTTTSLNDAWCASFDFPHDYKYGTDIELHTHWLQNNVNQTGVLWVAQYRWYDIGKTPPAWQYLGAASNVMPFTSGTIHQYSDFKTISGAAISNVSSYLQIRLFRNGAQGTGIITNLGFGVHYEADVLGSDIEMSK